MSNLSRRSLVTSAAALPALAVPAVAIASVEPDPIFALIERHRALFNSMEAGDGEELYGQFYEQGCVLAETAPTTLAGIIAIMKYRRELEGKTWQEGYELFSMEGGSDPRDHIQRGLLSLKKRLE